MVDTVGGVRGNPERTYRIETPEAAPHPVAPETPEEQSRREVLEALRAEGEVPVAAPEPTPHPVPAPAAPEPQPEPTPTERLVPAVQRVLAEGMYETYAQLPPALQQRFKLEGERTASTVARLLTETKVRVDRIIAIIRRWLALIPGANRYYLEQEAKLKADALLALRREP